MFSLVSGSAHVDVIAHANAQPRTAATLESKVLPALDELAADPETAPRAADLGARIKAEHFQASRTFTESLTVDLDDTTLELSHHGPGHTDNDAVVFVPELNLLHVGDLVFHRLRDVVESALKEGKSREQVMEITPAFFDDLGFGSILPWSLGGMFDALSQQAAAPVE